MKGIDIFCASQASTAICLSMEQSSSSISSSPSSSSTLLLGRAIDRYNPIIRDSRRIPKSIVPPCTNSQPPISPKPHHKKKKNQKITLQENGAQIKKNESSVDVKVGVDEKKKSSESVKNDGIRVNTGGIVSKSWRCTEPGGFISPPGSTRYLLGDKVNGVSDFDPAMKFLSDESLSSKDIVKKDESFEEKPDCTSDSVDQVVVLRVSLHCRGCERKMRKHISRMEGVTSFNIDFAAKKVTVSGKVTPLSVLSSISKVKNAQLWPPTVASSTTTPPLLNKLGAGA